MPVNIEFGAVGICLGIFLLITFGLKFITRNNKYVARSWLLNVIWLALSIYIIIIDGERMTTVAAIATIVVAGLGNLMFMWSNNKTAGDASLKFGDKELQIKKLKGEENGEEG